MHSYPPLLLKEALGLPPETTEADGLEQAIS